MTRCYVLEKCSKWRRLYVGYPTDFKASFSLQNLDYETVFVSWHLSRWRLSRAWFVDFFARFTERIFSNKSIPGFTFWELNFFLLFNIIITIKLFKLEKRTFFLHGSHYCKWCKSKNHRLSLERASRFLIAKKHSAMTSQMSAPCLLQVWLCKEISGIRSARNKTFFCIFALFIGPS